MQKINIEIAMQVYTHIARKLAKAITTAVKKQTLEKKEMSE